MDKLEEITLLESRIAKRETELIEVEEWIRTNEFTPVTILVTLIEGKIFKEKDIERYKERVEKLKE